MKKIHYSWIICAGCTLMLFCTVGLASSAFSVYQPYIIAQNGFSNTQASTIITVRTIASMVAMLSADKVLTRIGMRRSVVASLVLEAVGFALYGLSKSFAAYCGAAIIVGTIHSIGGMMLASIIISKWFNDRRTTALGICAAGSGAAAIISPPAITYIIEATSLRAAFLLEALFMFLAAILLFCLIRDTPEEKELVPYVGREEQAAAEKTYGADIGKVSLICVCIAMFLLGSITNMDTAHISMLYKTSGFDSVTVSFLLSLSGIALVIGKSVYGTCKDRMGGYNSNYVFIGLLLIGQLLNCLAGMKQMILTYAAMIFMGLGLSLSTVGITAAATDLSSEETFVKTLKTFQVSYMVGSFAFSMIPGLIADKTGSYLPSAQICVVLVLIYAVIVQLVYYYNGKKNATGRLEKHFESQ